LPSATFAECLALGKEIFAECIYFCAESPALGKRVYYRELDFAEYGTRQSILCRIPDKKHSAKRRALGKATDSGSEERRDKYQTTNTLQWVALFAFTIPG
jgi:hypothetical protein